MKFRHRDLRYFIFSSLFRREQHLAHRHPGTGTIPLGGSGGPRPGSLRAAAGISSCETRSRWRPARTTGDTVILVNLLSILWQIPSSQFGPCQRNRPWRQARGPRKNGQGPGTGLGQVEIKNHILSCVASPVCSSACSRQRLTHIILFHKCSVFRTQICVNTGRLSANFTRGSFTD